MRKKETCLIKLLSCLFLKKGWGGFLGKVGEGRQYRRRRRKCTGIYALPSVRGKKKEGLL